MHYINYFLFDIYPYLAGAIFLLGSWYRYDYGQYTWRAQSSQMLDKKGTTLWLNLFHIGVLGVFAGHFFGMLTPHSWYSGFISDHDHQMIALIGGGISGTMALVGGIMLLIRRFSNPRIKATSTTADNVVIAILVTQLVLGMLTIPVDLMNTSGDLMLKLIDWAQAIMYWQGPAYVHLQGVPLIFKLHIVLGLTIFVIFPFTRLVHMWSAPIGYIKRNYQVVRAKR